MQQHQPSNFSTYRDEQGNLIWDTFFVEMNSGNGAGLFAYRTWDDRELALDIAAARGVECQAVAHRDAMLMIRDGKHAWLHASEVVGDDVWIELKINYPARVA